jgi:hypothetical protein
MLGRPKSERECVKLQTYLKEMQHGLDSSGSEYDVVTDSCSRGN